LFSMRWFMFDTVVATSQVSLDLVHHLFSLMSLLCTVKPTNHPSIYGLSNGTRSHGKVTACLDSVAGWSWNHPNLKPSLPVRLDCGVEWFRSSPTGIWFRKPSSGAEWSGRKTADDPCRVESTPTHSTCKPNTL
jgi:hypothetical protein